MFYRYTALWLRFNCHSPESKQENSGQRTINVDKIKLDLKIKNCSFDTENVYIDWFNNESDIEKTVIPIDFLLKNHPERKQEERTFETSNVNFNNASLFNSWLICVMHGKVKFDNNSNKSNKISKIFDTS